MGFREESSLTPARPPAHPPTLPPSLSLTHCVLKAASSARFTAAEPSSALAGAAGEASGARDCQVSGAVLEDVGDVSSLQYECVRV